MNGGDALSDRFDLVVSPRVVLAGSPLSQFTVTKPGAAVLDALECGDDIEPSSLSDRLLDAGAIHPVTAGRASTLAPADVTVVTPQFGGCVDPLLPPLRLVVDDASTPPITGAALRLERNAGPAGARNAGRRLVTTPIVLFLDADVDVPALGAGGDDSVASDWWRAVLGHFDDPRVGLVAPRVIGDAGSSLDLGTEPARIRSGTRVSYVPGAALLVRVEAFDHIGGFDPALRSGEDVDFVWRLDEAGWRCRYEPGATVVHRRCGTLAGRLAQQVKYGASSGPLALRHTAALTPWRARQRLVCRGVARRPRPPAGGSRGPDGDQRHRPPPPAADDPEATRRGPRAARPCRSRRAARHRCSTCVVAARRCSPLSDRGTGVYWHRRLPRCSPPPAYDAAFGVGLWRSAVSSRTARPLLPRVTIPGLGAIDLASSGSLRC